MDHRDRLRAITETVLNPDTFENELRDAAFALAELFAHHSPIRPFMPEGQDGGDIFLPSGMALGPSDAAACTLEYRRTVNFLRAIMLALQTLTAQQSATGINIVYAGCGPYATLLFPLLGYFKPEMLNVTLLDVNPVSLESAKNIAEAFGLQPYLDHVLLADAATYRYPKKGRLDMVITETMQVSLKKEPHASIVKNLAAQLRPEGVLIPESVTVEAVLSNNASEELISWPLLNLTRETRFSDNRSETVNIVLPDTVNANARLYYRTTIDIYKNHTLEAHTCSLTMPRRIPFAQPLRPNERVTFYYELSDTPDFVVSRPDTPKITRQSYLQLPFAFDRDALLRDLATVDASIWKEHVNTGCYTGGWSAVALLSRSGETSDMNVIDYDHAYKPTPLLAHCPAFNDVLRRFETTLYSARLMRLKKESHILEHCDAGTGYSDGTVRLHIPVQTNDQIYMVANGQNVVFEAGNCYYLDASMPHSVHNPTSMDRVHLVVDCQRNAWLEELFESAGFSATPRLCADKEVNEYNVDTVIEALQRLGTPSAIELAQSLSGNPSQGGWVHG